MALGGTALLKAWLVLWVAGQVLPSVSGCSWSLYEWMLSGLCLAKFDSDMEGLHRDLWCSWPDTVEIYGDVTNCTYQVALRMYCFWPNQIVDRFFVQIHQNYFRDCSLTGRLFHDPPVSILAPFITVPVLITLLMTALVVWRSKRTEGVL
ncbi:receptor activity-modifying protein 1-like [Betta splendens]|uniref:Receptor activity-modifying protein 1 n=1 Tax=Betta splendens TaxID=158456 RepID=A0A6P7KWG9_BETSP|nr:receptor activity-modifying protein 1-like [Betta splendens]